MVTVEKEAPVTSPAPSHTVDTGNARQITLDILNRLFGAALPRTAAIQLWDGARWPESAPEDVATTVVLNHPGALRRMFLPPTELTLGEAFIRGTSTSSAIWKSPAGYMILSEPRRVPPR